MPLEIALRQSENTCTIASHWFTFVASQDAPSGLRFTGWAR